MQDVLVVKGGITLKGTVDIYGAKNAALKMLPACLLTEETVVLENLPKLDDISLMIALLGDLGVERCFESPDTIALTSPFITDVTVPYELVRAMRASIVVLGPLLARFGYAKVALPGGCAIGARPVDIHLTGLRIMGADIEIKQGFIEAKVNGRLQGGHIHMHTPTVTGTENLMMAATLAEGVTVLENAACEPEVEDLATMLNKMGAKIEGAGTARITIEGVERLHGARHRIIFDRIEAGTYLVAGAMTKGEVTVKHVFKKPLELVIQKLIEAGAKIHTTADSITVNMEGRELQAINLETGPYPAFPTDLQPQFLALNCVAQGVGIITEKIFENRFMHVAELQRLGANVKVKEHTAVSAGVDRLVAAPVKATDLRAAAALVLAGLVAEGNTVIDATYHIDRGYAFLEEKFNRLGGHIWREVKVN